MKTVDQSVDAMATDIQDCVWMQKGTLQAGRDPVRFLCDVALRLQWRRPAPPRGATIRSAASTV